jgi:hypothetical protein
MLEIEKRAEENPEAVKAVAEKVDDPLKSRLLEIVEERGES